jgi:hypothetical protein
MTDTNTAHNPVYGYFEEYDDDVESVRSEPTESDTEPSIERIIAEFKATNGHVWYLVKWVDCPVYQSSWECALFFSSVPWVWDEWLREKQRQQEGKSEPFDIAAFNKLVLNIELCERQKIRLQHLKSQAQNLLGFITVD